MLSYVLAYVIEGEDVNNAARWMYRTLADVQRVSKYQDVCGLYGKAERKVSGIAENQLGRMNARVSYLLCAQACLKTQSTVDGNMFFSKRG